MPARGVFSWEKKTLDNVNKPLDPCELDTYQQYITHINCKTEKYNVQATGS